MNAVQSTAELPEPRRVRSGRVVGIAYTGFAPDPRGRGCRYETLYGPAPAEALQAVLCRTGLLPGQVQARAMALGDVAILARMPEDAPPELEPGKVRPVCFIAEGLSAEEIAEALRQLMRQGWRP